MTWSGSDGRGGRRVAIGIGATVYLSGATAEIADLRTVTQADFRRVAVLALAAILLLVVALLRDVILSIFMVGATVLGYLATLGLTYWTFHVLGYAGLDWKVQVILFVVLVAVGQDYNIFFAVRLAEETGAGRPAQPPNLPWCTRGQSSPPAVSLWRLPSAA